MQKAPGSYLKTTFYLTTVTLCICCAVCFAYAVFIVPLIVVKPEPVITASVPGRVPQGQSGTRETEMSVFTKFESYLKILFPGKNDWRTNKPNILQPRSGQGLVLFRNEPVISPGRMEIKLDSCTFIIFPTDPSLDEKERYRQAIVIEASDNALISFKSPMGMNMQPDLNNFEKAELRGQVVISSAGQSPGVEDDFRLETRDVLLSLTQVYTKHPVVFQCGRQNGDGEELTISLKMRSLFPSQPEGTSTPLDAIQKELAEGNIRGGISITSVELKHLNRLQFPLGLVMKSNKDDRSPPIKGQSQKKIDELTPVDIRCKSGFRFAPHPEEPASWVGRFMDNVEVIVLNRDAKHDCLKCKNLYLHFIDPVLEKMIGSSTVQLTGKKLPLGKFERLEPYKIKADRSAEAPTVIDSPQNNFKAQGDRLIYDFREKSILLDAQDPAQRVQLKRDNITIEASSVCYRGGSNNQFVSLVAGKNGELEASIMQGDKPSRFRASWKEGLHVIPVAGDASMLQVSGKGGTDFFLDGLGTIAAEEVDFWGKLGDTKQSSASPSLFSGRGGTSDFSSFTPYSAQFRGNIRLDSFGARGNIHSSLTVRFQPKPAVPMQEPVAGGTASSSGTSSSQGLMAGNRNNPFELEANQLDLWIEQAEKEMSIKKLVVRDHVRLQEKNPTDPADPLKIIGDEVQIENPGSQDTTIRLTGNVASFTGKGLKLSGGLISVDMLKNSFAVVGPGKLSFQPSPDKASSGKRSEFLAPGEAIDIEWSRQMKFDGRVVSFQSEPGRNVVISQRTGGIRCPEVRLVLRNEVPIFKINPQASGSQTSLLSELEMIECRSLPGQPVHAELVSTRREQSTPNDPNHESTGYYCGEFGNFAFQYPTGEFLGEGPGWLRMSTQKDMKLPGNDSPAKADNTAGTGDDSVSTVSPFSGVTDSMKSFTSRPWKHMHLTFQKSFAGNSNAKCITLNQQVDLVIASSFTSENKLDITKSETQPDDAIFLNCQQLRFETVPTQNSDPSQDFIATGNVIFRHGPFSGRAQTVNYSVAKEIVRMEGNKIALASIYKKDYPGAPTVSLGSFMRGTFNVKTQKVDLENYVNTGTGL